MILTISLHIMLKGAVKNVFQSLQRKDVTRLNELQTKLVTNDHERVALKLDIDIYYKTISNYLSMKATQRPNITRSNLVSVVSHYVDKTVKHGGIVKNIRNNGIGPTPHRMKGQLSQEHYDDAQIVSLELFSTGNAIQQLAKELRSDVRVLRYNIIRADEALLPRVKSMNTKDLKL